MRRVWLLVIPMLAMMVAVMLPVGRADQLAVDSEAPWTVTHAERFLPPDWGPAVIQSVSPKGSWAYGFDETNVDQGTCYWEASTWERTCPDLEPDETISYSRAIAWSPDDTALVTPTYLLADERRPVKRLVRVELTSGAVTELYRPEPGTHIPHLAVSPDGRQLAFIEMAADVPITIRRVEIDGGEPETILTASDAVPLSDAADLNWTAAGRLVFYSGPYATDAQGYFRVNSDGSGLARIAAVTPGEFETRILDVSPDGRFMIAEGMNETEECGSDFFRASSYVVDLERDALAQVVCAVYESDMPGGRGERLFATTRVVASDPAFLPDGSIAVVAKQHAGNRSAAGLATIDIDSGRISIVSNDLPDETGRLYRVSAALEDGTALVWTGGYWRDVITLAPRAG